MPIYLYRCESCRETHEALQKVADEPLVECPHCGASALRKLIAPAGVIFKGSGFHKNDYSSTGRASGKSAEKSSDSGSKESKPESGGGSTKSGESSGGTTESKVA